MNARAVSLPAIRYPADLPVSGQRDRIVQALREHQVLIVAGETGSGKTTQLPKMCLEAGLGERGRIGCTQPRRVAALSISKRVAEELQVPWGGLVGCKMRFQDDTGPGTVLKFMTDGILLAEIQSDPLLRSYSAIILDEAHERSLNVDFLLGYLKGLLVRRPELKLLITSATIDTATFSDAFGGAPVIEVSGRTYPVEIRYWPMPEGGESDYLEAVARATEDVFLESSDGDVLVFLPTERDIREARDILEGSLGSGVEVLGLYGRMAGEEQQRIFSPGRKRRVLVSTNIAETSLTIPRIRYVIDSGLARMSRYAPRTRTKRLPVEAVSQSSANQRAGRAGRLSDGICVRLYSQEDFEKRPRFTQPEIQRANLAEVILRMKAFRLGEIETFPFLNPPLPAAIRAGYALLHELGALDDSHAMTPLGHELARLPLDPALGRMLLQARQEKVLPAILIIAAGLSVPDPRERPEEARDAAGRAHAAFSHPASDFLSYLKIWQAASEANALRSSNALRRLCRESFLSFVRMREWKDIHGQLSDAMDTSGKEGEAVVCPADGPQADAIHRAVLSAHLAQIGRREERNGYRMAGNRMVQVFPGSHLYERAKKLPKGAVAAKSRQPAWMVAAEVVETSQLFARTLAGIQPEWVVQVGGHLCEFRYSEPAFEEKSGRVLALERVLLHGMELQRGKVDYGKINAQAATEIFIREALLDDVVTLPHRFQPANRRLRDKLETVFARARSQRTFLVQEALFDFYAARLQGVSSVHDLNRLVHQRIASEPDFLIATETDLNGGREEFCDPLEFPDEIQLGNSVLPISYAYRPGGESDGVTVQVPAEVAPHLTSGQMQWMVPGLRPEIALTLLRALPKGIRKRLMPFEHKAQEIAQHFDPGKKDFLIALSQFISNRFGVPVMAADWPPDSLPDYLRPRVEVLDRNQQVVAASRDLETVRREGKEQAGDSAAWKAAVQHWHRPVTSWSFGDLPESVLVETVGGTAILGFPGLTVLPDRTLSLQLFDSREAADESTPPAVRQLAEHALSKDLGWLRRELSGLALAPQLKPKQIIGFHDALSRAETRLSQDQYRTSDVPALALEHLLAHALRLQPLRPLTEARFRAMVESARTELPRMAGKVRTLASEIQQLVQQLRTTSKTYPALKEDLARLVPPDYLRITPHDKLPHLPRYLKAMLQRGDRASQHPARDAALAQQLRPFQDWQKLVRPTDHSTFRWLLEEFRVSLFAQELGTSQPVSAKRLNAYFAE